MKNPICKNPNCNKEIITKTKLGKYSQHCSNECRYASPRSGKQYRESPPMCHLGGCDNKVLWNKDKRIWNKYCCFECGKKGRSIGVSKTKLQNREPKVDNRQIVKCSCANCLNIAILRNKKGTIHAYCSKTCRNNGRHENQKRTCMASYGVEFPMQNNNSFNKQQKNAKTLRPYMFNSGVSVMVRGYEPKALKCLEENNYTEPDLIVDLKLMPKIWYMQDNIKHRYYPDIYVPTENLIIEVKSTFTYNRQLEKNLLKRQACLDAGYDFKFMIFDNNGNLLSVEDDK